MESEDLRFKKKTNVVKKWVKGAKSHLKRRRMKGLAFEMRKQDASHLFTEER